MAKRGRRAAPAEEAATTATATAMEERMQNPVNQDLAGLVTDTLEENIRDMGAVVTLGDVGAIFRMARTSLKEQGIVGKKKGPRVAWASPEEFEMVIGDEVKVKRGKDIVDAQFISWAVEARAARGFAKVLFGDKSVGIARVLRPEVEAEEEEQPAAEE